MTSLQLHMTHLGKNPPSSQELSAPRCPNTPGRYASLPGNAAAASPLVRGFAGGVPSGVEFFGTVAFHSLHGRSGVTRVFLCDLRLSIGGETL